MKILVCGDRVFCDYTLLKRKLDKITSKLNKKPWIVTDGTACGAAKLARKWAYERRITYQNFHEVPPTKIANEYKVLVAFWTGYDQATKEHLKAARAKGKKAIIIDYEE